MERILSGSVTYADTNTAGPAFIVSSGTNFRIDDIALVKAATADRSFEDDFSDDDYDNDPTWTIGAGSWSAATGEEMVNAWSPTISSNFRKNIDAADFRLAFSYKKDHTAVAAVQVRVDGGGTEPLELLLREGQTELREKVDGDWEDIDTNTDADSTTGQAYDVLIVCDGSDVQVWRAESGGTLELILSGSTVKVARNHLIFVSNANNVLHVDNIDFQAIDPTQVTYEYNTANELTTSTEASVDTDYTYDDWGRMVTKQKTVDTTTYTAVYKWRYGSKLKEVETNWPGETDVSYMYDGLGKRRFKEVDPDGSADRTWIRERWEYEHDGSTGFWDIGSLTRSSFIGLGETRGSSPSTGESIYYGPDYVGSVRSAWDSGKERVYATEFSPYGNAHFSAGRTDVVYRYGSLQDASEVGHMHAVYRDFAPASARWISRDPLGLIDGPNVYAYTRGNPVNHSDLAGLACGSGWTEPVPDWIPLLFDFTSACETHDDCYGCKEGHYGKTKHQCDNEFLRDMQSDCATRHSIGSLGWLACNQTAYVYYGAVHMVGHGPYSRARAGKNCGCGPAGGPVFIDPTRWPLNPSDGPLPGPAEGLPPYPGYH